MERTAVVSSNVETLGYDAENQVVEVEFKGGRVYHYLGVDQGAWEARVEAESIGKWVAGPLKGGHEAVAGEYEPEEVEEEAEEIEPPTDEQIRDDEAQVDGDG